MTATLPQGWREWSPEAKALLLERLQAKRAEVRRNLWTPYPWQVPPTKLGAHEMWLMLGGRGTGKTDGCARYMDDHARGPACDPRIPGGHRMAIIAPTQGDAVESAVTGPSGLQAHNPDVRLRTTTGGTYAIWPNGVRAKLFGAHTPDDVERLRSGGNRCLVWLEELAAMRYLAVALEQSAYGLRIGPTPHWIGSTTPKPKAEIRALNKDPRVQVTRGRTDQATHLDPLVREALYRKYLGTRLGRQELQGELLEDVEGALWSWASIEEGRLQAYPPLVRIVVAVDPAASNTETSDETGIVVAGKDAAGHGYVLEDLSGKYSPEGWSGKVAAAYHRWGADAVVAEKNNGGDMVGSAIRAADSTVAFRLVWASRGKKTRAEPVSIMYELGRVHHVGAHETLEEQLTTWVPDESDSPDRLDAMVWALSELLMTRRGSAAVG